MSVSKAKSLIERHIEHYKKFPKISWLAERIELTEYSTVKLLRHLVDIGYLSRNYNQYTIRTDKPETKQMGRNRITDFQYSNTPIVIIRIIMAIVGTGATFMSIYYTNKWLADFLPAALSLLLSTIMILFSISAFETIVIFVRRRAYYIIAVFSILWLIVLTFSMVSTIAGQYNSRIDSVILWTEENSDTIHQKLILDSYNSSEAEILLRIDDKRKELNSLQIILSEFDTLEERKEDWRFYWSTKNQMDDVNSHLEKLREELNAERRRKVELLESQTEAGLVNETTIEVKSFYAWLSEIVRGNPQMIEFWLSVFPAVFIDLISPLALAVAMFLKRKEE
jgi:hypothetical protein